MRNAYSFFALSLSLCLAEGVSYASFELIQESTTHLRVAPVFNPIVQENLFDGKSLLPTAVAWSFGLGVEVPVFEWLNSGFVINFNTGLPDFLPVIDLSGIAKFQYPIAFGTGNFAPYLMIPLGITYTTRPVVDEVAARSPADLNLREKLYENGVGFNGSVVAGLEFFPIRYIGVFVEGGYRATVVFHQILRGSDWERTWQFANYWIRGATLSFGTKIAF